MKHLILTLLAFLALPLLATEAKPTTGTPKNGTVKASSFGYNPQDATECLQKALNSGAAKVIVDKQERDWLIRSIVVPSNTHIVLEPDVTIRAKPDAFHERVVVMIRIRDVENVIIEGGRNSCIAMPKTDYMDTKRYCFSEWRHAIAIGGSYHVTIRNLLIDGSGGDGIAVNRGRTRIENRDVTIDHVTMVNHHRLALGVGAVDGLLVRDCKMLDTMGTAPQAGMDFENNYPNEPMTNIRIERCLFSGNAAAGLMFILGNCNETTAPIKAVVEDCAFIGNKMSPLRIDCAPGQKGEILFRNCRLATSGTEAICINNAQDNGIHIAFDGCTVDATASQVSPVVFSANRLILEPFGNVDLGDTIIRRASEKTPLIAVEALEGPGLSTSITGSNLRVKNELGAYRKVNLAPLIAQHKKRPELLEFKTVSFLTKEYTIPEDSKGATGAQLRMRGTARFAQWVPAGGDITVHFRLQQVGKRDLKAEVEVMDANGGLSDKFILVGPEVFDYRLTSQVGKAVLFQVKTRANTVEIWSDGGGQAIPADRGVSLHMCNSELWFWVLAEQTEVKLEVYGEEPLCATLYDASGAVVQDLSPRFKGRKIILAKRKPSQKDELWRLKCHRVAEDYKLRIGAPSLPLFFTNPQNAVIRKK